MALPQGSKLLELASDTGRSTFKRAVARKQQKHRRRVVFFLGEESSESLRDRKIEMAVRNPKMHRL
jgi:hypothetical protein